MIIVAILSAGYEIEVRMLENNPTCLERAEIERVVGNQYSRLLRQQQDSKALSESKRHHHGGSRRGEQETPQPIRGYLLQPRKEGSPS